MTVPIFCVAHPVAPPCACHPEYNGHHYEHETVMAVSCNVGRAKRWIRWLAERCDVALAAPWIPYVETFPDGGEWRERGLRDDCAMASRCDGIILVSGRISAGMAREIEATMDGIASRSRMAIFRDEHVIDLTPLGSEPPAERGALPAVLRPR